MSNDPIASPRQYVQQNPLVAPQQLRPADPQVGLGQPQVGPQSPVPPQVGPLPPIPPQVEPLSPVQPQAGPLHPVQPHVGLPPPAQGYMQPGQHNLVPPQVPLHGFGFVGQGQAQNGGQGQQFPYPAYGYQMPYYDAYNGNYAINRANYAEQQTLLVSQQLKALKVDQAASTRFTQDLKIRQEQATYRTPSDKRAVGYLVEEQFDLKELYRS